MPGSKSYGPVGYTEIPDYPGYCINKDGDAMRLRELRYGEKHPRAKLTEQSVIEIRNLAAAGEKFTVLADKFGVSDSLIESVVSGKGWAHVGGPITPLKKKGPNLSPHEKEVIQERLYSGLAVATIARILGRPDPTIRSFVRSVHNAG